jgi:hypothetical protein
MCCCLLRVVMGEKLECDGPSVVFVSVRTNKRHHHHHLTWLTLIRV